MLVSSIDRKVYNVDQDIMSTSGSASDILKNIPSIEVDIDGQVSLRGSGDVAIFINGRQSPLMGKSRADVLQSLPGNTIERIEVITNPSARYRPDGSSGIINIVLKKNIKRGWNGIVTANAGNNNRYNSNVSLNYNPGKINITGSYGLRQDNRKRINDIERTYFDSAGKILSYYSENNLSYFRPRSNIATAGIDYTPNEQNSMGFSGKYFDRKLTLNNLSNRFVFNTNKALTGRYDRLRHDPEAEREKEVSAYYEHKFSKEGHEIKAKFSGAYDNEKENNRYRNILFYPQREMYLKIPS